MGEYFSIVCHTCRVFFTPPSLKLREIALNIDAAMAVGHFCTHHPGHHLELRGDEHSYDHAFGEKRLPAGYEQITGLDDDTDIQYALSHLKALKDAAKVLQKM